MLTHSLKAIEVVNLTLSIVGAATGMTSIVVSLLLFKWTGPRIAVEATHGITFPPGSWNVTVQVINAGRQAITIRYLEFEPVGVKRHLVSWMDWKGQTFPHRLEAGADASWRVDEPAILQRMLTRDRPSARCRAVAVLSTGHRVRSEIIEIDQAKGLKGLTWEVRALGDTRTGSTPAAVPDSSAADPPSAPEPSV